MPSAQQRAARAHSSRQRAARASGGILAMIKRVSVRASFLASAAGCFKDEKNKGNTPARAILRRVAPEWPDTQRKKNK